MNFNAKEGFVIWAGGARQISLFSFFAGLLMVADVLLLNVILCLLFFRFFTFSLHWKPDIKQFSLPLFEFFRPFTQKTDRKVGKENPRI
jgi:hypothetical protein